MHNSDDLTQKMESVGKFMKKLEKFRDELPSDEKKYMDVYCTTVTLGVKNGALDKLFGANDPLLKQVKTKLIEEEKILITRGVTPVTTPAVTLLAGNPKLDLKKL